MSETKAMRYGTVDAIADALDDKGIPYERDANTVSLDAADLDRLPSTDYTKLTFTKANRDWLPDRLRIGDELKLELVCQVIGAGKELTKDGLKPTAKLEVVGVNRIG